VMIGGQPKQARWNAFGEPAYEPASRSLQRRAQKMHSSRHLGLPASRQFVTYTVCFFSEVLPDMSLYPTGAITLCLGIL
jgi:hypothetical protein